MEGHLVQTLSTVDRPETMELSEVVGCARRDEERGPGGGTGTGAGAVPVGVLAEYVQGPTVGHENRSQAWDLGRGDHWLARRRRSGEPRHEHRTSGHEAGHQGS
jgi:hypothetical protein